MIDLDLTPKDKELIAEARAQALLARRHARDFEYAEDSFLPHEFPEAAGRPNVRELAACHVEKTSGAKIIHALLYLEEWYGGVPLREHPYSLGNTVLRIAGAPEQEARWKDKILAIAMTEPGGGSDPASTRTTAVYDPATDEWVLNGDKIFITYAGACDAAIVLARAVHPDRKPGLSTFLVERGTPGFAISSQFRKLGIRHEDTAALSFVDCRLPAFNHIAGDLKKTLQSFSESRPVVACYALGVSRAALDLAWETLGPEGVAPDYDADSRKLSAAASRLMDLEAEWEATYLTVLRAKWVEQNDGPGKIEASMAKALGGRLARRVTQAVVELIGPSALREDMLAEKWFRDGRIFDIYEGTGEIQRLLIARHLLGYSPKELN
ncbi:MAG TPA: acyl-CoA dehydrogenase family protein [Rhodoblastus sp.]|nr:acyl-CoA dehydrogenase family protein [Rhodoblastus sp.]